MNRTLATIAILAGYLVGASGLPGIAHHVSAGDGQACAGLCHGSTNSPQSKPADTGGKKHDPDRCPTCFLIAATKTALVEVVHADVFVEQAVEPALDEPVTRVVSALPGEVATPRAPPFPHA